MPPPIDRMVEEANSYSSVVYHIFVYLQCTHDGYLLEAYDERYNKYQIVKSANVVDMS